MIKLAAIDYAIIAAYFAGVIWIGFKSARKTSSATDFLLAGRTLTLPVFVMTLVSTWYGGVLGAGEYSYRYGISNWITQGVPYYFFALVFALLLAKRARKSPALSIPDQLLASYDKKTALFGAFLTFLLMTPAPYILMVAILLQLLTGWSLLACMIAGTIATTIYLLWGGFRSDVNTDIFEFFLMFLGFAVILPFAYMKFGGFDFIRDTVPAQHLTWHGGNSTPFVIVWFFIALWTLVDPAFYQRCAAAKSGAVAKRGIIISILFWFLFDAMTTTAGLYARAAMPSLDQPLMAYPLLAELTLPPIAKGLFYVGMLATMMSTLNTQAFLSASTLGRDIVWRLRGNADSEKVIRYTRWGLLVSTTIALVMAYAIPSVLKLWYSIGTVIIPGLLVPLVTSYFDRWRVSSGFALGTMLAGWGVSLLWLTAGWFQEFGSSSHYPLGIEPMYPGLCASLLVWGLGQKTFSSGRDLGDNSV